MPSPFPGMNPYLEQEAVWQDFHQSFILMARAQLVPQVNAGYVVKAEEHIFIHELDADQRRPWGRPALALSGSDRDRGDQTVGSGSTAIAPAYVQIPSPNIDLEHHSVLTVRDRQNLELITVIELLSPSNKAGADRAQYIDKRQRYLMTGINRVELDLLRGGMRLPFHGLAQCDSYALVARREEQPNGGIWPISIRQRLPVVPIPLRPPDGDAQLDLQDVLNRVYDDAGYENYIYRTLPQPPSSGENADWSAQFVPRR
ncbi:MAG TPA: DUF4058 family protein [Tepidisphaeraceae bacterium]|nr:DUF4058 family protein [Tepidisphaeraceae bacterium]